MTKTLPLFAVITAAYPLRDTDRVPMPEAAFFLTEAGAHEGFARIVDGLHEAHPDALANFGMADSKRTAGFALRGPEAGSWRPVAAVVLRKYLLAGPFEAAVAGRVGPVEEAGGYLMPRKEG